MAYRIAGVGCGGGIRNSGKLETKQWAGSDLRLAPFGCEGQYANGSHASGKQTLCWVINGTWVDVVVSANAGVEDDGSDSRGFEGEHLDVGVESKKASVFGRVDC
jgi:hypothetical protein